MKPKDKLRAYWSKKENGLMLYHPLGEQTRCDARLLNDALSAKRCFADPGKPLGVEFDPSLLDELDKRGYDLTTIRFSIEPKRGNQRFASQRI